MGDRYCWQARHALLRVYELRMSIMEKFETNGQKRPRIGISAEWLGTSAGGPETYVSNLIHSLALGQPEYRYHIYLSEQSQMPIYSRLGAHVHPYVMWGRSRWIVLPVSQPLELIRRPVDLFHATFVAPPFCPAPLILTVVDVGFERFPHFYPKMVTKRLSALTRRGVKQAKLILSISEYTKQELVDCYGEDPNRIRVTHLGVSDRFRPVEDREQVQAVRAKYGLQDDYILYVGKVEPRKNLKRLIQAYHLLRRDRGVRHKLAIVGMWSYLNDDVRPAIASLGLQDHVIIVGEVERADLPLLYNGASLFTYVSLMEGFGIPPIEAMACGIPVVVSNSTSLPEIVGNAGIYADPLDPASIADGLYRGLTDDAFRTELIANGFQRAKRFTWRATAEATARAYEEALAM